MMKNTNKFNTTIDVYNATWGNTTSQLVAKKVEQPSTFAQLITDILGLQVIEGAIIAGEVVPLFIPELNVCIEHGDDEHIRAQQADKARGKAIQEVYNSTMIAVKIGQEHKAINFLSDMLLDRTNPIT